MSLTRSILLCSAIKELCVVGSRWRRLRLDRIPSAVPLEAPLPHITLIPTLHVASIRFYDTVLSYMEKAVAEHGDRVKILLEGICDADEDEAQQREEYRTIMGNPELQRTMRQKADDNSLFSLDVQREMCMELDLNFETLQQYTESIRLQECYMKPKLAASCGLHLFNDADLTMKEVQAILRQEMDEEAAQGSTVVPNAVSISQLGAFPRVRDARERKVARIAREFCRRWVREGCAGEVIVPWGYFHVDKIQEHVCLGGSYLDHPKAEPLFIVADAQWTQTASFDVPEEIFKIPQEVAIDPPEET